MINLRKAALTLAVASSALLLASCKQYGSNSNQQPTASNTAQAVSSSTKNTVTISETANGFEPAIVTVKSGNSITWTNNTGGKVQIASDPHPTHTANPELTGGEFVIDLEAGGSKTVTVTKTGTWGYHDHLKPSVRGKVTVE